MRISDWSSDVCSSDLQASPEAGTCAKPDASVSDTPDSGTVKVTVAKNAKLLVGGEMGSFFTKKVANAGGDASQVQLVRSEEHTSELQSLMRISYAVFCLKNKKTITVYSIQIRHT